MTFYSSRIMRVGWQASRRTGWGCAAWGTSRVVRGVDGNVSMNAARHADRSQSIDDTIVQ